jgi:hypothetical protein
VKPGTSGRKRSIRAAQIKTEAEARRDEGSQHSGCEAGQDNE